MMQSLGCLALALLQDDGALLRNVHWLTIFVGIIAAAVAIGFLGMCVAGIKLLQLMRKGQALAERLEGKVTPMVDKTRALVEELGPKVRTIATNVEQISYTVRSKVDEFGATADEINRTVKDANKRTHAQVSRVDGMVSEALTSAQNVSRTVQQIAGIVAGVKKGVETLVERSPFKRHVPAAEERRPYDTPPPAEPSRYTTTTVETKTVETKRMTPYG
jgi:methyl-accepting chemotaxis protein